MSELFKISPAMIAAWCEFEPCGQFTETMSQARYHGQLQHAFYAGFASALAIEARSDTTRSGVAVGESADPKGNAHD